MNEQIEKLFDQALAEFAAENKYATVVVPDSLQRDFVEKFAELIVQECIKEVEGLQVSDWNQNWNQAIAHTALHLKEHFGVEE